MAVIDTTPLPALLLLAALIWAGLGIYIWAWAQGLHDDDTNGGN